MDTKSIAETRRDNLRVLLREAGSPDRISKKLNMETAELYHLASLNNEQMINSTRAREIEFNLGLESGWLDISHEYLSTEARQIAQKWLILPKNLQEQIRDYIDMQIESLRYELSSEDEEEDITDWNKIAQRETSWES